jgi:hypothetical protein
MNAEPTTLATHGLAVAGVAAFAFQEMDTRYADA